MSLQDILDAAMEKDNKKVEISEDRIRAQMPHVRLAIAYWREYPDMFVDFLCGPDNPEKFELYFYQRLFLRQVMRHRFAYATYPRAYSKSFLSVLVLMLRCVLYPNSHLFVTTGGKEQASGILQEKADQLCKFIPGLRNEINFERGQSKQGKDNYCLKFKNGSILDVMAASQRSRGKRAIGGLLEECISIDQTILNEVLIPTMNVDRRLADGSRVESETINKSQIYVTTAGYKNSFAYAKLMELLVRSIVSPEEAVVMGGTWRIPVMEGLQPKNFIQQLKADGTYNDASFAREYESHWVGDVENSFFSAERFDKYRTLTQPEEEYNITPKSPKGSYYILGVDVGRFGCTTECAVIKVTPQPQGTAVKSLVNIYTWEAEHFGIQAMNLKRLYYKFRARRMAVDANGLGAGLMDFLVIPQTDPVTGDYYPGFGVMNDPDGNYKKMRQADTEVDAIYQIKAHAGENTEAYSYVQTQISSGKTRFLIDEVQAKAKLLTTKLGNQMSPDERATYLVPFQQTSILRDQMLNLVESTQGVNIILKQSVASIKKDKFSAFTYGLYYIKQVEEKKKKKSLGKRLSDMVFFSPGH